MDSPLTCPYCKTTVSEVDFFCPNCGKKLKEKPLSTTFTKQLLVYLLSFFLPPFGLWPAIKYLHQTDEKSKRIGLTAIILTVVSFIVSIWLILGVFKSFQAQIGSQLELYQDLGF